MKKIFIKKITDAEIQALVNNSIKEVILCETTTTRPVVTYNDETKEIVFGYKYPAYFFTYEELAENINDTSRKLLSKVLIVFQRLSP